MESVEYEPAWSVGAICDNDDIAVVANMIDQCNDYGMDAIETRQRAGDVHGMHAAPLCDRWTAWPGATVTAWWRWPVRLRYREGVGDILAEGTGQRLRAALAIPSSACTVRGRASRPTIRAASKGMGIGYATSNRGGCHLRGYTPAAEVAGNVLGSLDGG